MASATPKLSLLTAIIINLNIMLGSGIFINTAILVNQAGSLASLVYAIVGILLFPLILAIAKLMQLHKSTSTFYDFGKTISPYVGFLSIWAYFIAKLASCGLGIHVCVSFLQRLIPALATINILALDSFVVLIFILLNLINIRTGQAIHFTFIFLKLIPTIFAIITGAYLFSPSFFTTESLLFSGIPISIPLVLYAFTGFEASCSLSRNLDNPEKNGPKAVLISYFLVVSLVILYQFFFYGGLGLLLGKLPRGYLDAFPTLIDKLFSSSGSFIKNNLALKNLLEKILHIGIASSSLGSAYAILYSNNWNLFTLAESDHVIARNLLLKLNKYGVPFVNILIQASIVILFLLVTRGAQVPLQQVGALGAVIAYTLSTLGLGVLMFRKNRTINLLPIFSLLSCSLLLGAFLWSIIKNGFSVLLVLYILALIFGSLMFLYKLKSRLNSNN